MLEKIGGRYIKQTNVDPAYYFDNGYIDLVFYIIDSAEFSGYHLDHVLLVKKTFECIKMAVVFNLF